VPEIGSGVVEIKAAAREPGHRTKIAVWSNDPNVDPVGACVGARGSRVRMVTNELRGERVDVVPFSDDPVELIQNALAPARVREVRLDEETGTATVIVSDFQLSLAIGKEGQNARLAARLTGWRIDIKSETQLAEEEAGYGSEDWAEGEWVEDEKGELVWKPAEGGEAMSASEWTHAAEEPAEGSSEEVVVVTESPNGDVTVEDVVVTETPDGEVIIDDIAVTESADGEISVEEVVVVSKDGEVEEVVVVTEASEEADA
jgi:N utilization substance protein A